MKIIPFLCGLLVLLLGLWGIASPGIFQPIVTIVATTQGFLAVGTVRITLGLILILTAAQSRMPRTIHVIGIILLIVGVATFVTVFTAMDLARDVIDQWMDMGDTVMRATSAVLVIAGGFIAYCFAPGRSRL